ncbi:MAG: hypothetical protein SVK54_02365 [candidate division WOR-3 bacterium]|nr:hypothetical protein [candidate division WOR-3 bacterium]
MRRSLIRITLIALLIIIAGCSVLRKENKYKSEFDNLTAQRRELRSIIEKNRVTRLDIAYLTGIFLPLEDNISISDIPFDLRIHLYPGLAYTAVRRGMMKIFPDSSFKPDEYVKRYQLAIFFTRYILSADPFFDAAAPDIELKDVSRGFFAYKPIVTVVERDLIETDNGNFYPFGYISGSQAVEYFYRLSRFYSDR